MTPADVRDRLITALRVDLVGPALADELLSETPTRWYLTGFLAPRNAGVDQRSDPEAAEQADLLDPAAAAAEDNGSPDRPAARRSLFPASLGLSVLVSADTPTLTVQLDWGDYQRLDPPAGPLAPVPAVAEAETTAPAIGIDRWQRTAHTATLTLNLPASGHRSRHSQPVPTDPQLKLAHSVRAVPAQLHDRLPPGARVVSIFLSNERGDAHSAERRDEHYVFQPEITVTSPRPFLPQPNLRGRDDADEWDERLADLHDRAIHSYAVGHGVATETLFSNLPPLAKGGRGGFCGGNETEIPWEKEGTVCFAVRTAWIPQAAVEFVAASPLDDVELRIETLADVPDFAAAETALRPLISGYRHWIQGQQPQLPTLCLPQQEIGRERGAS